MQNCRKKKNSLNFLFLHNPKHEIKNYNEIFDFFEKSKENGLINFSGLSLAKKFKYNIDFELFDAFQDDFNLLCMDSPIIKNINLNKKIFFARSPLATSILTGKIDIKTKFDSDDYRSNWLYDKRLISILKRVERIKNITDIPILSLAKRFVIQHPRIDKVIFGVKSPEHVIELIEDLQAPKLPEDLTNKLSYFFETDYGLLNEKHLTY